MEPFSSGAATVSATRKCLKVCLTNVMAIAAGAGHSLALRRDGTIVSWGVNDPILTVPEGLSNVIAIAGGRSSSAAIVLMPESRPPLVSRSWTQAIKVVVVAGAILLLAAGCLWLLVRRTAHCEG